MHAVSKVDLRFGYIPPIYSAEAILDCLDPRFPVKVRFDHAWRQGLRIVYADPSYLVVWSW